MKQHGTIRVGFVCHWIPFRVGPGSNAHLCNGLVEVLQRRVLAGAKDLTPYWRSLRRRRQARHRITNHLLRSLKSAILEDSYQVYPLGIVIATPHTNAVRGGLLDDYPQHMFEQSVRIRLLSERVERSSERLQLSLRQVLRFTHCVLRSFPLDRESNQSNDLVDDLKMLRIWATRLRPVEAESS